MVRVRGQTRTSSLGAARPLPPKADVGPGGQSVGQAAKFCLAPLLLALPAHRLARRVFRLEPRLRRPAAVWRIRPLRDDALQPHAADVMEDRRAVTSQMLNEPDGSPLRLF